MHDCIYVYTVHHTGLLQDLRGMDDKLTVGITLPCRENSIAELHQWHMV